jgi:hypothetical protein
VAIERNVRLEDSAAVKVVEIEIQDAPGGKDLTSGECSLGQTIPI